MVYVAATLAALLALSGAAFGFSVWRQRKRTALARAVAARAEADAGASLARAHAAARRAAAERRIRESADRIRSVPLYDLLRKLNRDANAETEARKD